MKYYFTIFILSLSFLLISGCKKVPAHSIQPQTDTSQQADESSPKPELDNQPKVEDIPEIAQESPAEEVHEAPPAQNPIEPKVKFSSVQDAISKAEALVAEEKYDEALNQLIYAQYQYGNSDELQAEYDKILDAHPKLNAQPKRLIVGEDVTSMKRIGGGSSLVYKLIKDKETIAAFKPFQKRFQSNYRSEIAAYRLCPLIKCGFDIPVNLPVYFEYHAFSGIYGRNPLNPKEEFNEIIPTHLPDGSHRVDGTFKDWIPDFADFPIEFTNLWMPWVNPGTTKQELNVPVDDLIPFIAKKHKQGEKYAQKLEPHLAGLTKYEFARQISNMIVFDYLINNWDRFSGSPTLYGVNCQIAHGRFMSIDNGAAFPKTPNPKPEAHLHQVTRFSRTTYEAIKALDRDRKKVNDYLMPEPSEMESAKLDTFWRQRALFLEYVQSCIAKNGEAETFFFE